MWENGHSYAVDRHKLSLGRIIYQILQKCVCFNLDISFLGLSQKSSATIRIFQGQSLQHYRVYWKFGKNVN